MIPHERSLVEKMQGRPFALIGVNSDPSLGDLKKALQSEHITWRHFYDGGTSGPIARQWKVNSWPTIYILDANGVIRYKDLRGAAMEQAVETLLGEMNREASARPVGR